MNLEKTDITSKKIYSNNNFIIWETEKGEVIFTLTDMDGNILWSDYDYEEIISYIKTKMIPVN